VLSSVIGRQYDQIVKDVAAPRLGTAEAATRAEWRSVVSTSNSP
jgi:hypothetical protein